MNIGLFMDSFFPRIEGVTVCMDAIAREYIKLGHNVIMFVPEILENKDLDDLKMPYKVVRCKNSKRLPFLDYSLPRPKSTKGFYEKIINESLDVVHIHSPFSVGSYGINFAKKHDIPSVATMHTKFDQDFLRAVKFKCFSSLLTKMIVKTFNKANVVTTMNPACVEIAKDQYKIKPEIKIIPNGTVLKPNANTNNIIKELKEKYTVDNEFVIVCFGRVNKLKNLEFSLNVIKELKNQNVKVKLLIAGSGKDTSYYKKMVERLGIENEVVFCGRVTEDEKMAIYTMSDLHIFPSFYDTDGIVKLEAAACKTPTIFIENTTAASVITNNVNGYICKNDISAFVNKIIELINNPDFNKTVSENAQRTLVKRWDEIAKMFLEVYQLLIDSNNKTI